MHTEQETPKYPDVTEYMVKFISSQRLHVTYSIQSKSDQRFSKFFWSLRMSQHQLHWLCQMCYRCMGWISTLCNWWLNFACFRPAINLQKVTEVHSKIFFLQPNQMLAVLKKGEADINVFHDSSSQPSIWKEYRCIVSVTAQEPPPYAMKIWLRAHWSFR